MATNDLSPQDKIEDYLEPQKIQFLHKWAGDQIAGGNRRFSPASWWMVQDLHSYCSTMKDCQEKAKRTVFEESRQNAEIMQHLAEQIMTIELKLVTFRSLKNDDEKTTLDMFCSLLKLKMWADIGDDFSAKDVAYVKKLEGLRPRYITDG